MGPLSEGRGRIRERDASLVRQQSGLGRRRKAAFRAALLLLLLVVFVENRAA